MACRPLGPREARSSTVPVSDVGVAFAANKTARHSQYTRKPFSAGGEFRGYLVHTIVTACQVARPPVRIRPICSALGSFYFQASNGSVALPVAGYDYNSDWTPLLTGLSPAGMAASLAALEWCSQATGVLSFSRKALLSGSPIGKCRNLENSAVPTLLVHGSRLAFYATMCRAEGDLECELE